MARIVSTGRQSFEDIRSNNNFYVDKTGFVRAWWLADDDVTLVCRPRRFGKTLNLDTVRCFFSTDYAGQGERLFGGLEVWDDPAMRALQGSIPVVFVSFANIKQENLPDALQATRQVLRAVVRGYAYLLDSPRVDKGDRLFLARVADDMDAVTAATCLQRLCAALHAHWGTRPVVLLDEYDAPMQEAWSHGYWDKMSSFMRSLMNSTFKTNPDMARGLITGVTRVSRESIFSDLNNLEVVTCSTNKYQTDFGFTQGEVDEALAEYGLSGERHEVGRWYDGFTFGGVGDIYNPWSITKFLASGGIYDVWWANTSGNGLVSSVVRAQGGRFKADFERLMAGGRVEKVIDEQVVFSEMRRKPNAVWALLLAAGYVTAPGPVPRSPAETPRSLELTNREVRIAFDRMAEGWFADGGDAYDGFAEALLAGDARAATRCLADVTRACMSSFDGGTHPAESEPERFYHGLVLGMLASLRGRFAVESNRESGYGRYDVALVPTDGAAGTDPAAILEFKVFDPEVEETLADTVSRALGQIEGKAYVAGLVERGIAESRIHVYGVAFRGKEVLVGQRPTG